jgi:hypothetical protein
LARESAGEDVDSWDSLIDGPNVGVAVGGEAAGEDGAAERVDFALPRYPHPRPFETKPDTADPGK